MQVIPVPIRIYRHAVPSNDSRTRIIIILIRERQGVGIRKPHVVYISIYQQLQPIHAVYSAIKLAEWKGKGRGRRRRRPGIRNRRSTLPYRSRYYYAYIYTHHPQRVRMYTTEAQVFFRESRERRPGDPRDSKSLWRWLPIMPSYCVVFYILYVY